jgi:hypothetical protein
MRCLDRRQRISGVQLAAMIAALIFIAPADRVHAQNVRGRVLDEVGQGPVPGAVVSIIGVNGIRLRSALTNREGAFLILGVAPGSYRLRVEMIGRRTIESEGFEVSSDPPYQTLRLPVEAIRLSGIDVAAGAACSVGRDMALATYQVWEEAQKALRAAAITRDEGLYRFVITEYHRQLDMNGRRVTSETSEERVWVSRDPFNSLPPEEVERAGYVRDDVDGLSLYGPNTDVLLSPGFLTTHCFQLREERGRPDQIGVRFEPVRGREIPDIEGVVWLDRGTSELRTLEFRYRNLPRSFGYRDHTGFAEFARLDGGAWIIRSWWLRSPLREEAAEVKSVQPIP